MIRNITVGSDGVVHVEVTPQTVGIMVDPGGVSTAAVGAHNADPNAHEGNLTGSIAPATDVDLGGVLVDGDGLSIDVDGLLHNTDKGSDAIATLGTAAMAATTDFDAAGTAATLVGDMELSGLQDVESGEVTNGDTLIWNSLTLLWEHVPPPGGSDYELPAATDIALGGVIVDGDGLSIDVDGTMHNTDKGSDAIATLGTAAMAATTDFEPAGAVNSAISGLGSAALADVGDFDAAGTADTLVGNMELMGLADVNNTTPPVEGDVLVWDETTSSWIPEQQSGGGGGGDVVGPAVSVASNFAVFDDATGKVISDSTIHMDTYGKNAGIVGVEPAISAAGLDITIGPTAVVLYNNGIFDSTPEYFTVDDAVFLGIPDNSVVYLYIEYNAGAPRYAITIDVSLINESNTIPVNTITTTNGHAHLSSWDSIGDGLPNKLHRRFVKTQRFARERGCTIAADALSVSEGVIWRGAKAFELPQVNFNGTGSSYWYFMYWSGAAWVTVVTPTLTAAFNYTQYNDRATGLEDLTGTRCNINWVFRGVEEPNHVYYVLSDKYYKDQATAHAETVIPELPPLLATHACLIGRVICENDNATPLAIESAFDAQFTGTVINDHNSLSGLQGGIAGEYNHLTAAQVSALHDAGSDDETATSIGAIINGASAKTTPHDDDMLGLMDSEESNILNKLSWANLKATAKTYFDTLYATITQVLGRQTYHGFVNRTGSSITSVPFNNGTLVFTLARVADYVAYFNGVPITITVNKTIALSAGVGWTGTAADYGQWFVWMAADGNLHTAKTPWSILDLTAIPVVTIHWDGTTGLVAEERHGYMRNLEYHQQAHFTWGTQYLSGFTPVPSFGPTTTNAFSFIGGIIADEDIQNSSILLDSNYVGDGNLHKHCQIGYRAPGGASMIFEAAGLTYAKLAAGLLQYDNAGTLTNVTLNYYGIHWVFATNRLYTPIVSIVGQGNYANIAAAQAAPLPTLAGMSTAEWKPLYRVICRRTPFTLTQVDILYNLSTGPAISAGAVATPSAASVTFTPAGNIIATNVQSALEELDGEKQPLATVLTNTTAAFTTEQESKLSGIEAGANLYTHPTGDGNLHVPANSTTNDGKVLTAGAVAGTYTWEDPPAEYTHPTGDGNLHVPATSTTNDGKVLTAGATAGSLSWETPTAGGGDLTNLVETITVGADCASVTFSNLDGNAHGEYILEVSLINKISGKSLHVAINGDTTTGNYSGVEIDITNGTTYNNSNTGSKIASTETDGMGLTGTYKIKRIGNNAFLIGQGLRSSSTFTLGGPVKGYIHKTTITNITSLVLHIADSTNAIKTGSVFKLFKQVANSVSANTEITVTLEGADSTCFPLFVTGATGVLAPKSSSRLTFDAGTGKLASTLLAADTITANVAVVPDANDGAALGTTALQFSDLFLAEGGVINWDNGDMTMTQAANLLTLAGGSLKTDLFQYTETAAQAADTTSPIALTSTDGNVIYRTLTENTEIRLPAKSGAGVALSITLYIIGASTYTLSIKDVNAATTDVLDIGAAAITAPGAEKRSIIKCTSINGSVWFVNQVYKEA